MIFPDVERGVEEVIQGLGFETAFHLPKDYDGKSVLVQLVTLPSNAGPLPFLRTETIQVNVVARGRTRARDVADTIRDALTAGPHGTSKGLLDRITCQVSPFDSVAESDLLNSFSATYLVDVRPIS